MSIFLDPDYAPDHAPTLQGAFDIALVPEGLDTDDAVDQGDAYLSAVARTGGLRDTFLAAPCSEIDLAKLETIFKDGNSTAAVQMLQHRRKIVCGRRHTVPIDNTTMFWDTNANYLDMLVCVGLDMGLGPVIPLLESHHNFAFKLDLRKPEHTFRAKHVKLGFDPMGCMFWIGSTGAGEDAWLAFIPHNDQMEVDDDDDSTSPSPNRSKTTCLTDNQQKQALMFIAHCLHCMHYRAVVVDDPYPEVTDDNWQATTHNVFGRYIDLNLDELKSLDENIRDLYYDWVAGSPDSYQKDRFFTSRRPICVTSRFGQNHRIGVNAAQERDTWEIDRDWSRVRYVNVAIATHISVRKVDQWFAPDVEEIVEAYPEGVFASPDEETRNELSREELQDILDTPFGEIIPRLYSKRGYIIDTHDPGFVADQEPYGILVKAVGLHNAFAPLDEQPPVIHPSEINNDADDEDNVPLPATNPTSPTPFFFYPQAGLRTVGHFQAKGLMSACYPIVGRLNEHLRRGNLVEPEPAGVADQANIDPYNHYTSRDYCVIEPLASQGYNALMHHTRGRGAQHHDAQMALVTSALAGQWAGPASRWRQRATDFLAKCQSQMPHESFNRKIRPNDLSRDLRLENVYCFDMLALHPNRRTGPVIIDEIIRPLRRIWNHANTRSTVENHVQLFRPTAYPALYSWTTYPLTSLLDVIFSKASSMFPNKKFTHTLFVELCSVVERALNYMHTGNAAVIASSVMTPLWIGKAIVVDGFPCLNPEILTIINGVRFDISAEKWPLEKNSSQPATSSKATHLCRYDQTHFNVFYAHFAMGIVVAQPPPPFVKETNELRRRAFSLMAYSVNLFIDDCKQFVSQEVSKHIKRQLRQPLPYPEYGALRNDALKRWKSADAPLAYGGDQAQTYATLLSCISENPQGDPPEGCGVAESLSYHALSMRIIAGVTQATRSVPAPLWKNGSFTTALEIAIPEIRCLLSIPDPDSEGILTNIMAITLRALKVDFVPWHAQSRSSRGMCRTVSHLHWMAIDRSNQRSTGSASGHPLSGRTTEIQRVAADRAFNDKTSRWNVPHNLSEMKGLWDKAVLPFQWDLEHASIKEMEKVAGFEYVVDTYKWVFNNYHKDNWRHHMGLVWAILITAVIPRVSVEKSVRAEANKARDEKQLNDIIRGMPWVVPEKGKKGVTQREPFITMLSTYIIAMVDKSTPFAKHLKKSGGNFGIQWTKKHNPKCIHAFNLIRLGIAEAKTAGVARTPSFQDNFDIRPDHELKSLYERVVNYLCNEDYGVYFAIREIFGQDMADQIVREGHGKKPIVHSSGSTDL